MFCFVVFFKLGYSRKNPNREVWGHGISRGIEERACGNSRVQLKKELEFARVFKKISCRISMCLGFLPWDFQGVSHNFAEFSGVKACSLWNSKGKVTYLKIPVFFLFFFSSEKYVLKPLNPPCLDFSGIAHCYLSRSFWNSPLLSITLSSVITAIMFFLQC